ncbi:MAG: universal stress protein [Methyloversatilis sp.]|nr:universal stress protein [Methyloversatilis sp.]MBP6195267.1 universal stress protein [Methyloversatilis sp.]MBP9118177.1 universal stress protein [Methyloversatilis sp.]
MDALKSILLHVDASPQTVRRMQFASALATAHGAAVTALYATWPASIEYANALALGAEVAPMLLDCEAERRTQARAQFDAAAALLSPRPPWTECSGEPVRCMARQACCADLVVVGQRDPRSRFASDLPLDFVEAVTMASGRPVLVVPCDASAGDASARVVVVAWKATREATRAVTAALPLLRRATKVHVVTWQRHDEVGDDIADAPDIIGWLRSHAVSAVMHRFAEKPEDVGAGLLAQAQAFDADLLVMGCYGRSRAREWILGGATRTVLESMALPVLMAH